MVSERPGVVICCSPMKRNLQLYGFVGAVILLAALVALAGHSAWKELRVLRRSFATVQTESFHLADHIEAEISDLKDAALLYDLWKKPADAQVFAGESEALLAWITRARGLTTTAEELSCLDQMEPALKSYLEKVRRLLEERQASGPRATGQPLLDELRLAAAPVLELSAQLKAAERAALGQFVRQSQDSVEALRLLLGASVALVAILGLALMWLIYRAKIAPLRAQVVESRALLERHEKLASLGTLAAGVAHEIRNPLTAINVRVHGLKRTLPAGTSEHEDVSVIDEEIRRLDRIVRDFLDFARPSEPRSIPVSVEGLFNRVQSLLAPQWRKAAIQFRVEAPPDVQVQADPHQLEQVLINLVQNAADSIQQEGTVTLRARAEQARLPAGPGPAVLLEVIDTGPGIPPEIQRRVFDPFFTTKEGGTGLGLSIAASIVEKHGGVLQFRTQLGRGTTFTILLPRADRPEEGA